ncbi:MAG TPA: 6-phosphogluconolactonase, partial [Anaeromyxobacter sp.]
MTRLTVEPTEEAAALAATRRVVAALIEARAQRGRADLGLAGGTTPRLAYRMLDDHLEDWNGIHLWFCDDRAVGPEAPDSNYAMVAETLLAAAPIPAEQVHRVLGELGADAAAAAYREELAVLAPDPGSQPVLDLALLGMGPDGHTASLFPHHPALEATESCVAVHDAPKPPPDRVTLTVPC